MNGCFISLHKNFLFGLIFSSMLIYDVVSNLASKFLQEKCFIGINLKKSCNIKVKLFEFMKYGLFAKWIVNGK